MNDDFSLAAYDYELPARSIAQFPAQRRGASRLMVLPANSPPIHSQFASLADFLPPNALLVANNSKVLPARLLARRPSGGKLEFLLLSPLPVLLEQADCQNGVWSAEAECLLKGGAKLPQGAIIDLAPQLQAEILAKGPYGRNLVRLRWKVSLESIFQKYGSLPLPPYIRRSPEKLDQERYQTIYASECGSVAAPTAGLHFNEECRRELLAKGFGWTELTLHVGYGTFSPVREQDIRNHAMHAEFVEINDEAARKINAALKNGQPIVAIGSTSLRALEGVAAMRGTITAYKGWIKPFIYPGYKFRAASWLLSNFHLPKSSLLMLVAAFVGRRRALAAYEEAVRLDYRFFSYGDATLLQRRDNQGAFA